MFNKGYKILCKLWLIFVIAWNYGYPQASPLEDVVVAIILSLFSNFLKKFFSSCHRFTYSGIPLYSVKV